MDNGGPGLLVPVSKLDRRRTGRVRKRNNLLTGEGGGEWREGAKSLTTARKPGPLLFIQYSLAIGLTHSELGSLINYLGRTVIHYTNVYDVERSSRRK